MTRRPPSLSRLAILLTLPVLLVAGMGVWVIRAERARVEGDAVRAGEERADLLISVLRRGEGEIDSAVMPRCIFLEEDAEYETNWYYEGYLPAQGEIAEGRGAECVESLVGLTRSPGIEEESTPTGLPLFPLLYRALLDADTGNKAQRAAQLYGTCLRHPSLLTGRLALDAKPWLEHRVMASFERETGLVEALLRDIARMNVLRRSGGNPAGRYEPEPPDTFTPERGGWLGEYFVSYGDNEMVQLTAVQRVKDAILRTVVPAWNPPAQIPLTGTGIFWNGRVVHEPEMTGKPTAVRESGVWRIEVARDTAAMAAGIAKATNFLKWVLANVLLTMAVAMWMTYRAFKKQAELARMQSEFVASVSHELRTPVAGIGALAERLESGKADAAQTQEYHRMIAREGRRLAALVDNVLDFSRIERGAKAYDFEHADLLRLVRETCALLRPHAEEKGLTLVEEIAEVPEDRWPLVDAVALRQALVNLVDNAIKFTPAGGTVTVGFGWEGAFAPNMHNEPYPAHRPGVCLSVKDTGIGIPAAEHARIFERFHRVDNGLRRETTGAGIGLSIVKHIAEAHGARVSVESEAGQGAVFAIHFCKSLKDEG